MERLGDKTYDPEEIHEWSKLISDDIKNKLKGLLHSCEDLHTQLIICCHSQTAPKIRKFLTLLMLFSKNIQIKSLTKLMQQNHKCVFFIHV